MQQFLKYNLFLAEDISTANHSEKGYQVGNTLPCPNAGTLENYKLTSASEKSETQGKDTRISVLLRHTQRLGLSITFLSDKCIRTKCAIRAAVF
jgi:hypothetical protein